jgi:glycerol-3-phosphate acyltransferase PlsY
MDPHPLWLAAYLVATYLVAAIPFGLVVYRIRTGKDIRAEGSGNIGATNVLRNAGKRMGVLVLGLDVLKGLLPVVGARLLWDVEWVPPLVALVAVVGHCFPAYLRFRGGKGVATALGAIVGFAPLAALALVGIFLVLVVPTRIVSLGSMMAAAATWLVLWMFGFGWPAVALGAATGVVIVFQHRKNLVDLVHGRERRLGGAS